MTAENVCANILL